MFNESLSRISKKLDILKNNDPEYLLFGASTHEYQRSKVLSEDEILHIEKTHNITLPPEYRAFLKTICNGNVGPYYGLNSLDDALFNIASEAVDFSQPFPFQEAWNLELPSDDLSDDEYEEQIQAFEEIYFSDQHNCSLLYLSNFGCGIHLCLVVKGECYGEIWTDDRANSNGIYPDNYFGNTQRLNFLSWYELWLDQAIEKVSSH